MRPLLGTLGRNDQVNSFEGVLGLWAGSFCLAGVRLRFNSYGGEVGIVVLHLILGLEWGD
jgi:hypothetical protein